MKKTVTLNDKTFEVMIPAHEIDRAVAAVAECLNADYGDKERPIFVGVLNGAFMFLSDLIKKIDFTCEISFVKLASYEGTCSTGNVECLLGLNNDIAGRHVIIVEDIVDTGRSIAHMYADLMRRNPASVEVCTLFFKPNSYRASRCRSATAPSKSATNSSWDTDSTTTSWAAISKIFTS